MDLITGILRAVPNGALVRSGTVTSIDPFRVTLHGPSEATPMPRLASYTPAVDHIVAVLVDSTGAHLVLGQVVATDNAAVQTVPAIVY